MADVSIDSSVSTSSARGFRAVVFTTASIGYWFYIDSDGTFGYSKTSDGGASWGVQVEIAAATTHLAYDVWFDQWTPGDSGTLIHTCYFNTTNDDVFYRTLDTNGDGLGTQRTVFAGASATLTNARPFCSVTKTTSGYLYVAFDLDAGAEKGLCRSTDAGVNWSADLAATFVEAQYDWCSLFPASGTGDGNDCWAIYFDYDSINAPITLKLWDSSAVSEVESATILTINTGGAGDLELQYQFSASVRHSDGHLILAILSKYDSAANSNHQVFDITSTSTFTEKTAIQSSTDDHYYPQVYINQSNDYIYVAYNGKRDGSETLGGTTKVYYTKSTDGGANWTAGDTAYMEGAAGAVRQVWAPITGPLFYAGWRVGTTLLGNAVNSVPQSATVNYTLTCAVGAYTYSGVAATLIKKTNYALTCAVGAYTYTGNAATLTKSANYVLTCAAGAYAYSGVAAALSVKHSLVCDAGAYAYTGQAATLLVKHSLTCAVGAYSYTGNAATLTYVPGAGAINYVLNCSVGSYTLTGQAATFEYIKYTPETFGGGFQDKKKKHSKELTEYEKIFSGLAKLQPHVTKEIAVELLAEIEGIELDEEDDVLALLLLM